MSIKKLLVSRAIKIKFSFLLLLLLSVNLFSQRKDPAEKESLIRLGFKAGLNLNKIQGQSFKNEFRYNYQLGGFLQINPPGKFGVQPEINFVQTTAEQSGDITVIYDDIFLGGEQKKPSWII